MTFVVVAASHPPHFLDHLLDAINRLAPTVSVVVEKDGGGFDSGKYIRGAAKATGPTVFIHDSLRPTHADFFLPPAMNRGDIVPLIGFNMSWDNQEQRVYGESIVPEIKAVGCFGPMFWAHAEDVAALTPKALPHCKQTQQAFERIWPSLLNPIPPKYGIMTHQERVNEMQNHFHKEFPRRS